VTLMSARLWPVARPEVPFPGPRHFEIEVLDADPRPRVKRLAASQPRKERPPRRATQREEPPYAKPPPEAGARTRLMIIRIPPTAIGARFPSASQ